MDGFLGLYNLQKENLNRRSPSDVSPQIGEPHRREEEKMVGVRREEGQQENMAHRIN